MRKQHHTLSGRCVRITFLVSDQARGREALEHLTEERLVAGGAVIAASSVNWIGGEVRGRERREVTAYTAMRALPLIRARLAALYGGEAPVLSQFVMDAKEEEAGWIFRNVRQ